MARIAQRLAIVSVFAVSILCIPFGCSTESGAVPKYEILSSLESTNRNAVHIALWTLDTNEMETPAGIDFDSPYKDNAKHLESLAGRLAKLDSKVLEKLDKSLAHHWQIYSPIWGPKSENWD